MNRPAPITWLLLLLVLVPTGVLAWLGFQAADGFDAADEGRLESDLEAARTTWSQKAQEFAERFDRQMERDVARAAATLAAEAPDTSVGDVIEQLWADRVPVATATLYDAHGKAIWPAEYVADDVAQADRWKPSRSALLGYLRRSADIAYFGEGGLEAAEKVWNDAGKRFRSDPLRQLADVEAARLRARATGTPEAAAKELGRLREKWGPLQPEASELGRPLLLLQMAAQRGGDEFAWKELLALVESGKVARIPLTAEERARLLPPLSKYLGVQDPALFGRERRTVTYEAPVAHGARLVVAARTMDLILRLFGHLADTWLRNIQYHILPRGVPLRSDSQFLRPDTLSLDIPLPGGAVGTVHYQHREWVDVRARRKTRRLLLSVGVAGLFLLTLLGLGLTRRSMARERAARRMRDEFIANVTHEVRTPLTSVLLHSEMLADEDGDDARRREYARVVRAQGKRLAQLVDDMLDFSALERGTRTIEAVPVDLGAACREAVAPYLVLAAREGVEATCKVVGAEVPAMGDPAALARVLGNLLGNAWKHGRPARDEGASRVHLHAFEEDGRPTVEVRDNGPGIPPAERATIFERFGRGRGAVKKEGAGIGLSLSRDLARAMGGDLDVRDEGRETVFRLRLPPVPDLEV